MSTVYLLFVKDLRRVVRNPIPILIGILIPLFITAMIGLVLGGSGGGEPGEDIAPLRVGVVDHDDGVFSRMLRGSVGQPDFKSRIDARFLEEDEAMKLLGKGALSAVIIIPKDFTAEYLAGDKPVSLTLIKNPAESIYPTLAQEGMEIVVAVLNALARNIREDLNKVSALFEEDREFDWLIDGIVLLEVGIHALDRVEAVRDYLVPPVISYEILKEEEKQPEEKEEGKGFSVFAYILAGMTAMFLLMHADTCMRDLYRESRGRTLERFRTFRGGLLPLIGAKVFFSVIVLSVVSIILLGGGALVFGFAWSRPLAIAVLALSYCVFAAGWTGFVCALAGKERRADLLNNLLVMGMSITGGAMWPTNQLPQVVQKWITPWMPTHWFTEGLRGLQGFSSGVDWVHASSILITTGVVLLVFASQIFNVRLERGIKE